MNEDIKAVARRIWEEVFLLCQLEALPEVIHPDWYNHAPPMNKRGLAGARATVAQLREERAHATFSLSAFLAYNGTHLIAYLAACAEDLARWPPRRRRARPGPTLPRPGRGGRGPRPPGAPTPGRWQWPEAGER